MMRHLQRRTYREAEGNREAGTAVERLPSVAAVHTLKRRPTSREVARPAADSRLFPEEGPGKGTLLSKKTRCSSRHFVPCTSRVSLNVQRRDAEVAENCDCCAGRRLAATTFESFLLLSISAYSAPLRLIFLLQKTRLYPFVSQILQDVGDGIGGEH